MGADIEMHGCCDSEIHHHDICYALQYSDCMKTVPRGRSLIDCDTAQSCYDSCSSHRECTHYRGLRIFIWTMTTVALIIFIIVLWIVCRATRKKKRRAVRAAA